MDISVTIILSILGCIWLCIVIKLYKSNVFDQLPFVTSSSFPKIAMCICCIINSIPVIYKIIHCVFCQVQIMINRRNEDKHALLLFKFSDTLMKSTIADNICNWHFYKFIHNEIQFCFEKEIVKILQKNCVSSREITQFLRWYNFDYTFKSMINKIFLYLNDGGDEAYEWLYYFSFSNHDVSLLIQYIECLQLLKVDYRPRGLIQMFPEYNEDIEIEAERRLNQKLLQECKSLTPTIFDATDPIPLELCDIIASYAYEVKEI